MRGLSFMTIFTAENKGKLILHGVRPVIIIAATVTWMESTSQ